MEFLNEFVSGALTSLVMGLPVIWKAWRAGRAKDAVIGILKDGIELGRSDNKQGEAYQPGTVKYFVRSRIEKETDKAILKVFKKLVK